MAKNRLPKYMRKKSGCYFFVVGKSWKALGTDFKQALINYLTLRGPECPDDIRDSVNTLYLEIAK